VNDWTDGYVADIEYTYGYFGELNPLRTALLFLNAGLMPPKIQTACELGFGQGVSVNVHAAASDVQHSRSTNGDRPGQTTITLVAIPDFVVRP
jgi:hypothetical protein